MNRALCFCIDLIKSLSWWGDAHTIVVYIFLKFTFNILFNGNWLFFKHSKKHFNILKPNSGGTFLPNFLVRCLATSFIYTCFLVWSSSDIPRSSLILMALDVFSWYRFTTHLVCATFLPTVVARNASECSMRESRFFNFKWKWTTSNPLHFFDIKALQIQRGHSCCWGFNPFPSKRFPIDE